MRKRKFKAPVKAVSAVLIIFLALCLLIGYIWKVFNTSDYFKIKYILTRDNERIDLSYLVGRNIFSVDLEKESRYILDYYPDCNNIRVVRLLPDRLFVDFIRRRPIALVKLYKYFAIDQNGVLFSAQDPADEAGLPVIAGLETKIFGPKAGNRYNSRELLLAMNIIKEIDKNKALKNYKIVKIDVANINNTSMLISVPQKQAAIAKDQASAVPGLLEVKLGPEGLKGKLGILSGLLTQVNNDVANMKYIDLRFDETVIKLNDVKPK